MDPSKANPREYIRQVIDAEIKSLEESTQESIRAVIAAILSFLRVRVTSVAFAGEKPDQPDRLAWLRVTHVCHQWREVALNHPLFWSHIDFTKFSSVGTAEILARAKKAPLYLEARIPDDQWDDVRLCAFQNELQDHVSHICHLTIRIGPRHLDRTLKGLVSTAPALEYLWLSGEEGRPRTPWPSQWLPKAHVPDTFLNGITPRLSCFKLWKCDISWQSPLLRGLKHLEIRTPYARPRLSAWLDALDEMPQLKTLSLYCASPIAPPDASLPYDDVNRTVTLPSLTLFEISCPTRDFGFVLAHLILPALTSLCLILTRCPYGGDVREILPYVARHAHGPQDTLPLQSMFFRNDVKSAEILAWTLPDIDLELPYPINFRGAMRSARVAFSWSAGTDIGVFDAVMAALPLDGLMTLTSQSCIRPLNQQFWLRHVSKWPLLECVRLSPSGGRGFMEMLLEDSVGRESPLLPSLKILVLINTLLCSRKTLLLCDALTKRVEQGIPLEALDLRTCLSDNRTIELLSEIVDGVLGPEETFETGAQMTSACLDRGLYLENSLEDRDAFDEDESDEEEDEEDLLID